MITAQQMLAVSEQLRVIGKDAHDYLMIFKDNDGDQLDPDKARWQKIKDDTAAVSLKSKTVWTKLRKDPNNETFQAQARDVMQKYQEITLWIKNNPRRKKG